MRAAERMGEMLSAMMRCDWGHKIWSQTNAEKCEEFWTDRVMLHVPGASMEVRMCKRHRPLVDAECTPESIGAGRSLLDEDSGEEWSQQ